VFAELYFAEWCINTDIVAPPPFEKVTAATAAKERLFLLSFIACFEFSFDITKVIRIEQKNAVLIETILRTSGVIFPQAQYHIFSNRG